MTRILIFSGYFHPHQGGSEAFMLKLGTFLTKHNITCDVITCNTERTKRKETINGITVYRVPSWHLLGNKYPVPKPRPLKKQLKKLQKISYDYVFTNTRFFNICAYAPKFVLQHPNKKLKLVHVEHGSKHTNDEAIPVYLANILYDYLIGKQLMQKADKLFGISDASRAFVKKLSGRRADLVRNCIDTSLFNLKKNSSLKKQLGIAKNKKIITYAGRVVEAKGVQDLIKAAKELKATLIVLGSGDYVGKLKELAKNQDVIFLEESFNKDRLIEVLSISTIFVHPSYNEGLPTMVLEAGALGLPIIATNVGSTKEIIQNNKNGYLIPPKNIALLKKSLKDLLNNTKKRNKFGKAIKNKIKKEFDVNTAFIPILKLVR